MAPHKSEEGKLKEVARRMVEFSCREQGLEVQITDPVVIGKVAAILRPDSNAPRGYHKSGKGRG